MDLKFDGFMKGVNLGGWLSQCDHTRKRYDSFIMEDDIVRIASWGLDHVRLPFDNELVEDASGKIINEGFNYIDRCIGWCEKHGLNIIIDLHKAAGYTFNNAGTAENNLFKSEELQERFINLWVEVSRRYSHFGKRTAFELLNEVVEDEYCDPWNALAEKTVTAIRKNVPDTKIIIGGTRNNSVSSVPLLPSPFDKNMVYTFHCYEPFIFTHQKAHWVDKMPADQKTSYPDTISALKKATAVLGSGQMEVFNNFEDSETCSAEFFEKIFQPAVQTAKKYGVPLYCGEYGVIDQVPEEDSLKWYRDIAEAFNRHGIGRAAWTYKEMNFGLTDTHYENVLNKILQIL